MMKTIMLQAALAAGLLSGNAFAGDVAPMAQVQTTGVPAAFRQAVHLRGTIGDDGVQVTIRPKVPADEGVEGEYFFFGQSLQILLAGEIEGDILLLEESQDGTHISGQWDGTIAGDRVTGEWMSADGEVTKPFALQIVPATGAAASAGTRTPQ